ncbi:MAG: RHS repeat protein, partial [Deltaproteobacteria bacterium]|nr:RHS repeat protein [Deltaproteobacteria bacterium]
ALYGSQEFAYDYMGNVIQATDQVGLSRSMEYDGLGNLLTIITADGRRITSGYDAASRRVSLTDGEDGTTTYSYDYQDNLTQVEDALGGTRKYTFDRDNRLTKTVDEEGSYRVFFYDEGSERVSKVIDGSGNEIKITYRSFEECGSCPKTFSDKPVRVEFPTFTRQYKYDIRGRLTRQSDIIGTTFFTEKYSYDKGGRLIWGTDRNGRVTKREYDNLDRLIVLTDPAGGITRYRYDSLGNLESLTDARDQVTRFDYDQLGRKIREVRPLGNTLQYSYDPAGRLLERTDARGQQVKYLYSSTTGYLDGYILRKNSRDFMSGNVRFSYDKQGRLSGYDDGITTASYEYDQLGRQTKALVDYGGFTAGHSYSYYKNGLKKSYSGPDGLTHTYRYTPVNKLKEIDIATVGKVSYSAYKWLKPERVTMPGVEWEDRYDGLLRLSTRKSTTAQGTSPLELSYRYDAENTIIGRT